VAAWCKTVVFHVIQVTPQSFCIRGAHSETLNTPETSKTTHFVTAHFIPWAFTNPRVSAGWFTRPGIDSEELCQPCELGFSVHIQLYAALPGRGPFSLDLCRAARALFI